MSINVLIVTILLLFSTTSAQISVSQGFVDDATKAFIELRAEREVNKALERELLAKNQLIEAQKSLIESQKLQNAFFADQVKSLAAIKCDESKIYLPFFSFLGPIAKKKQCR